MKRAGGTNEVGAGLNFRTSRAARSQSVGEMPRIESISCTVVRRAMRYVEERLTEKILTRHVAQFTNVTPEHFCRTFKRSTGLCLNEYLARLRIAKARHALADSDAPIAEIAFACGFRSLSQFNKTFKKVAEMSPTEFRLVHQAR